MAELTTMLTGFSKDLLQTVIDHLENASTKDREQLGTYQVKLTQAIANVRKTIHSSQLQAKSQKSQNPFLQLFDAGITRAYGQVSNDMLTEYSHEAFQKAVIDLYTLEHEIVDFLTKGKSKTNKYAIYYNVNYDTSIKGCEDVKGEFFRGVITPKQVKEFFNVTEEGDIQLKRSSGIIEKLQEQFKEDNSGLTKKYQTEDVWEKLTNAVLGNLMQYFRTWQQRLNDLGIRATEEHLGEKRWNEYQKLRELFGATSQTKTSTINLMQVYKKYMLVWDEKYAGFNMRRMAYNRGHLAEAFERYLVELKNQPLNFEPNDENIRNYLNQSVDNLPWFAGGDVGSTQVKALFSSDRASVQISSATTLCELGVELANLLRQPNEWIAQAQAAQAKIDEKLKSQAEQSQDRFKKVTDTIAETIANQLAADVDVYTITKKDQIAQNRQNRKAKKAKKK